MYEEVAQQYGIKIDPQMQKQVNEGMLVFFRSFVNRAVCANQILGRKGRPPGWGDLTAQKVLMEASQNVLMGDPAVYAGAPMLAANQALPAQPVTQPSDVSILSSKIDKLIDVLQPSK